MKTGAKSIQNRILTSAAGAEDAGLPLARFLARRLGLSRRQISSLKFRENGLRVNGKPARTSLRLTQGDLIEVRLKTEGQIAPQAALSAEAISADLQILFENEDVIIVNKPSGVVCHPSHGHYADSLASQVTAYLMKSGAPAALHVIGRLDKDTSGAMIYAKNAEAAARLSDPGAVRKTYYALAEGRTDAEGLLDSPIAPDLAVPGKMKTDPDGKPAQTRYQTLACFDGCSLLRLRLTHGRTHQIRVHMSDAGHALLGDPLYGSGTAGSTHAMLHCVEVRLILPFTNEPILIRAPFPADWPAAAAIS